MADVRQLVPATARELTSALRTAGTLRDGDVVSVEITGQRQTSVSHLRFLSVEFSPGTTPELPKRFLLKWPQDQSPAPDRGGAETTFYRELAPGLSSPPIAGCLATASRTSEQQWLILEDLRDTHACPPWPERPSDAQLRAAVGVLAQLHSRWWDASGEGVAPGAPHTEASLRAMIHEIGAHLPAFIKDLGNDLSGADRDVLETVFSSSFKPWLRLVEPHDLTVIHGDAHTWNFLFPRSGDGTPYLIDWQTWHRDTGARDLAFLMALHWDAPMRQRLERPLLQHYHQTLIEADTRTYTFDDLWLDYRRCVVRNLTFPIIFWSRGFPREIWRYRLDCALAAYRDLDAAQLL
jgi:hypothetical protein